MPNSRFALHGKRPSLIHGLCAFFASNSRFMRLFQAALDTCLDSPFFCQPLSSRFALHGLRALDEPLISLGKKGKTLKKRGHSLQRKKARKPKKTKERKQGQGNIGIGKRIVATFGPKASSGNGLRVKTQRVKTSETFSEESNLPRRFRRYPEIL